MYVSPISIYLLAFAFGLLFTRLWLDYKNIGLLERDLQDKTWYSDFYFEQRNKWRDACRDIEKKMQKRDLKGRFTK